MLTSICLQHQPKAESTENSLVLIHYRPKFLHFLYKALTNPSQHPTKHHATQEQDLEQRPEHHQNDDNGIDHQRMSTLGFLFKLNDVHQLLLSFSRF